MGLFKRLFKRFDAFEPNEDEIAKAKELIAACEATPSKRSLDDERVFMENLLVQRLNFLLVVFSIFVAAGFTVKSS